MLMILTFYKTCIGECFLPVGWSFYIDSNIAGEPDMANLIIKLQRRCNSINAS